MANEPHQRIARIDKSDLADLPADGTEQERGRWLRLLLRQRGIDPHRLFRVEYYPHYHRWLVIQEAEPGAAARPTPPQPESLFYRHVMAELRRAALTAFASQAARSVHFASHGSPYQLPPKPQELTPAKLVDLLGGPQDGPDDVRFTGEGGWHIKPSEDRL